MKVGIFTILFVLFSAVGVGAVTINETLDTTAPAANPAYRADTGAQTGRLTRDAVPSACGSLKTNPGLFATTGARQYDDYRFIALSNGCVTVTLNNAGNNILFGAAYNQNGLNTADPSLNYLADMGASPTTSTPSRSFSFDVFAGQAFHVVIHEVDPGGAPGQTYTLDVGGVKIDPDFTVTEVLDTTTAQLNPAYARATGNQTGRLNRFSPASDCTGLKPNPGLFSPTGARRADLYVFTPASSGCARVTLSHTGADQAQIVVYDQNGFVPSNPSTNYLADPGQSALNSSVTFSFVITRGVPFFIVVSEVTPGAGIGDTYTLNISDVKLVPTVKFISKLDTTPPSASPDFVASIGAQTGRINRFPPVADCNAPKPFPGLFTAAGARQYDEYTFVPTSSGCVEVTLRTFTPGFDLYAVAYNQPGFVPSNPGTNYLADHGNSPNNTTPRTFSFNVVSGVPFSIVVHEVNPGMGIGLEYSLEVRGIALNVTNRALPFNLDGDARTDAGIFRPGPGEWWYLRSIDGTAPAFQFGASTDIIAPADFTGDGLVDIAFFRPSTGFWYILRSEDQSFYAFPFGASGDIPFAADYDGDGMADATVFRPSSAQWFFNNSSGGVTIRQFGLNGDVPLPHDFDGDNRADLAIFRPSLGEWYYERSSDGQVLGFQFGATGDRAVPADYSGDGRADIAFFRPSTGFWYILRSEDGTFYAFPFGASGDDPVPGDYDGDGLADPAMFRPSNGTWYLLQSTNAFTAVQFGQPGDIALPKAYIP
ncbi:MAG: VCBS repeat-containing protein [Acidobacteriota bacterium]|nr:VCBS repeat-containing protein [Acidobacteriota bacterium]